MKKLLMTLILLSLILAVTLQAAAAPVPTPASDSAGEEMGPPPGESPGGPGGAPSDGESNGDSAESSQTEDDGVDAVFTFYDEGENTEREQTEAFHLTYYENGGFDDHEISGFLFTSDEPSVNFYFSELSDNKEQFFRLGGTAQHITPEESGAEFSKIALDWMSENSITSYDSAVILRDGGLDDSCDPVISAKGWTYLDIDHLLLYAEGSGRCAVYSDVVGGSTIPGPGAGGMKESQSPVVVIRNSLLETTGQSTADINSPISFGNSAGRARGIQPQGMSRTYLYHSAIVSRTWGAFSTDSARQNLDLVSYNSLGYSTKGYGAYADTSCHLFLYGSSVIGSSDGITASNDGEIYAVNTACPLDSISLRAIMGKTAKESVSPADYLREPDETPGECLIAGGNCAVQFHMPDQMHQGSKNTKKAVLYMEGGTLLTKEEYISAKPSPYTARYSGALLVTKSTQADVLLEGTQMDSSCRVLIHSMINSDQNVNYIPDGETAPGSDYTLRGMNISGDIINEDYQRAMRVTLDATVLSGAIFSHTCEDWNTFCKEELEGDYILDPDGYQTLWGVELTLCKGSVWNVTEESTLTGLTIDDGCIVNGVIIENEDGTITVTPDA